MAFSFKFADAVPENDYEEPSVTKNLPACEDFRSAQAKPWHTLSKKMFEPAHFGYFWATKVSRHGWL